MVTHVFISLVQNALVAWRLLRRQDKYLGGYNFRSLDIFRQCLSKAQSCANFLSDMALELLELAANMITESTDAEKRGKGDNEGAEMEHDTVSKVSTVRARKLVKMAEKRQQKCMKFFQLK